MERAWGVPAAHENEYANDQIEQDHNAQIVFDRKRLRGGRYDQAGLETAVLAPNLVAGLRPYSQCPESLDNLDGAACGLAVDGDEHITGSYPGSLPRGIRRHEDGLNTLRVIRPG